MTKFIAFTGAQGTGKTTMRKLLIDHLQGKGKKVVSQYYGVNESIARDAKVFGFAINEQTTFLSQYYMANRYIVVDLETRQKAEEGGVDYVIVDRSPLDVIPYSNVSKNITRYQKEVIEDSLYEHYKQFPAQLVYCEPLGFIEADNLRSTDMEFQDSVVKEFEEVLFRASGTMTPIRLSKMPIQVRFDLLKAKLDL